MARSKKPTTRVFEGTKRKVPFRVETILTDSEAIAILRATDKKFPNDCADHIEIMGMSGKIKMKPKMNLVAWGFRLAGEPPSAEAFTLPSKVLGMVAYRRPLSFTVTDDHGEDFDVKIACHGANSKYEGQYLITDGGDWPANAFYGRAQSDGLWKPTGITPACVVDAIKTFGEE